MRSDTGVRPIPCWTLPFTTAPSGSVAPDPGSATSARVYQPGKPSMTLTELAQPTLPAAPLVASVSTEGAATVVTLRGEADLFTLPIVVDVLARAIADHDGPVIVDLALTEFIDSGTVRTLARAWTFLDDRGRKLTVRSPSTMAVRMLELFGLTHRIEPDRTPTPSAAGDNNRTFTATSAERRHLCTSDWEPSC